MYLTWVRTPERLWNRWVCPFHLVPRPIFTKSVYVFCRVAVRCAFRIDGCPLISANLKLVKENTRLDLSLKSLDNLPWLNPLLAITSQYYRLQ